MPKERKAISYLNNLKAGNVWVTLTSVLAKQNNEKPGQTYSSYRSPTKQTDCCYKSSLYKYYTLQGLNKLPKTPEMRDKAMKKNICMN